MSRNATPHGDSRALRAAYESIDANTTADTWLVAAKCKGLMAGYNHRWHDEQQGITLQTTERTIESDLRNPDTTRPSRTYTLAGKLDKVVAGPLLYDHKTTSSDLSADSPYWQQLAIESQVSHYELMLWMLGEKIERAVWDVVRKPGISPRKLTKKEVARIVLDGTYFGSEINPAARVLVAGLKQERESKSLYQIRLAAEVIANPDRYFARRVVPRTDDDLVEYAKELWAIASDMRVCRANDTHYRNPGACMNYGRPCQFLGICSGYDRPDSHNWKEKCDVHSELPDISDGRDVITNSRARCFQTCRRKHYYKYELGIERIDAEDAEAIYFGNVWHAAMDAWWAACNNEREDDGNKNEA
jgi:hypothetical protein